MDAQIVEAVPIREQVADIIRKMIVNEELKPNQKISERQISQMLQVSTTPVKEAFRVLQSEGLLYSVPRKGSFVSKLSKKNMLQTVYMRSALEGVAAYFAGRNATYKDIMDMEEALQRSGRLIETGELTPEIVNKLKEENNIFHAVLRRASRNSYLVSLIENMRGIDQSVKLAALNKTVEENIRQHREHMSILTAIKKQESEKAEQYMIAHVRRVGEMVLLEEGEEP